MRRASGVSPRTPRMRRVDRAIKEHGIRAPRRKIVGHEDDGWAMVAVLSCGHHFLGRGSDELGRMIPCHTCRAEKAEALIAEGE